MTDLGEFLLARIAEDEERARQLQAAYDRDEVRPPGRLVNLFALVVPAHVLADCDAKRRMVKHHGPHRGDDAFPLCATCTAGGPKTQGWPCLTLRLLALPYTYHPDYREEWRP